MPGKVGGASRDRTGDLLHAMQALSQLSYGPTRREERNHSHALHPAQAFSCIRCAAVGEGHNHRRDTCRGRMRWREAFHRCQPHRHLFRRRGVMASRGSRWTSSWKPGRRLRQAKMDEVRVQRTSPQARRPPGYRLPLVQRDRTIGCQ